jgi:thiamine-monophosphate kinase
MNERDIIECLNNQNVEGKPGLLHGIGDDCAVLEKDTDRSWLVSMDTLVETVHFDLRWHPAEKLGRKAVAVNVSDIAAMGGKPLFIFLSLGLPQAFDPSWVHDFSDGIAGACREYGCLLVGGDTVHSREGVMITITVIGEVPVGEVIYRNGALPGDIIWVSGELGLAAAGLEICKSDIVSDTASMRAFVEAHLNPQPRVRLGRMLAKSGLVHAMMDLSDGVATDLSHLCKQSGVGAVIQSEKLPASPDLHDIASLLRQDPFDLMLKGGEDYELVFVTAVDAVPQIKALSEKAGVSVTKIGTIVEKQGVSLILPDSASNHQKEVDISFAGFDHFPNE